MTTARDAVFVLQNAPAAPLKWSPIRHELDHSAENAYGKDTAALVRFLKILAEPRIDKKLYITTMKPQLNNLVKPLSDADKTAIAKYLLE
ncbi:MAG: hypothetical protein OEZ34_06275 [Spirochaetia bacterium]|nr:hypothetical protein [Spirochaetia bacterium]